MQPLFSRYSGLHVHHDPSTSEVTITLICCFINYIIIIVVVALLAYYIALICEFAEGLVFNRGLVAAALISVQEVSKCYGKRCRDINVTSRGRGSALGVGMDPRRRSTFRRHCRSSAGRCCKIIDSVLHPSCRDPSADDERWWCGLVGQSVGGGTH